MSENVKFQPPGPFWLPAAQSSKGYWQAGSVELRLRVLIEGVEETIAVQMAPLVAQEMAAELLEAAVKAKEK